MRKKALGRLTAIVAAPLLIGGVVASTAHANPSTPPTHGHFRAVPFTKPAMPHRVLQHVAGMTASPSLASAGPDVAVFAGANRYQTAVVMSQVAWADDGVADPKRGAADTVVLARGDNFADALAGGPFAAWKTGPLLLTPPSALPSDVLTEIERILPAGKTVYVLGSASAVSTGVESALINSGFVVKRLAGADRFDTAIKIAQATGSTNRFFFATGLNYPDALAAGTAAAALDLAAKAAIEGGADPATDINARPVVIMPTQGTVMLQKIAGQVERGVLAFDDRWQTFTAGAQAYTAFHDAYCEHPDCVASGVLNAAFTGVNRFDTAVKIAEGFFEFPDGVEDGMALTTGLNFPDALGASAFVSLFGEPLLLTETTKLSTNTHDYFVANAGRVEFLDIVGGALTQSVIDSATAALTTP